MFHHESTDTERFGQAILLAVRQILQGRGAADFLQWAEQEVPRVLGLDDQGLEPFEVRRLARLLATAIWNATPRPDQGFRTLPLPPPPPMALCPCGSGRRYRHCCGAIADPPELSSELIWELLLDELPEPGLRAALAAGAVPDPLLGRVAERWLEQDRPGRAVTLLEPLFAGPLAELGTDYEPAFDTLCDAYDRLDHWRKKHAFLERVSTTGSRAMRAAAWQRRCTMRMDDGDFAGAREAFAAALRSDPDNPGNALLEITLLAAQHQDELARARAQFWRLRLHKAGHRDQGFMDFLAQAACDPQAALVDSQSDALDPLLMDLQDWVDAMAARPLPDYRAVPVQPASDPPGPEPLTRAPWPPAADRQGQGHRRTAPAPGLAAELRPPPAVRRLEARWATCYTAGKPESTLLTLDPGGDPARPETGRAWQSADWSNLLLGHPELGDSLDVLDDLATALYEHPESALPWVAHALLRPLVERAWEIVTRAAPPDAAWQTPWTQTRNRPALRLLFRRYLCQLEAGQPGDATLTLETLLRLNPQDHHGVRAELMNHYLRQGEDARALTLVRRFPDDLLADLAYGEVLALYRLGEKEHARAALGSAVDRLPRIPHYLTRERIKRPRLSPLGFTPGGEDQAWLYREAMRDVWAAEPGILRWLKRVTA